MSHVPIIIIRPPPGGGRATEDAGFVELPEVRWQPPHDLSPMKWAKRAEMAQVIMSKMEAMLLAPPNDQEDHE